MAEVHSTAPIEYREITGFPGYRAGTDGSIWQGDERLTGFNHQGYRRVVLRRDDVSYPLRVHVLILETFVGPRPPGMEACHYPDRDKTNNRLSNLRWDTHAENCKDEYRDLPPITEKVCKRCRVVKPLSEFYPDRRDRRTGRRALCKACNNEVCCIKVDREKHRTANLAYYYRQKEKKRCQKDT